MGIVLHKVESVESYSLMRTG